MFALTLVRIKRTVLSMSARVLELVIAVAMVFGLGLFSSWYMVEAGSRFTTARIGPWVTWTAAARPDADPYTRAHFAAAGTLAVSTDVQRTFQARTDSAGDRLDSWCDYLIEGQLPRADWWSIGVFNQQGLLVPNPAGRHGFTSQTVALGSRGTFQIMLAREARPGNWIPTRGAGRLSVVLTVVEPRSGGTPVRSEESGFPTIKRLKCR